jgi:hypothetical protein
VERDDLRPALAAEFDGEEDALAVVSRQARDLADSRRLEADLGVDLDVATVVAELEDAPAGHDLVERWNWWIGSLEMSYGGYQRFLVRPDVVQ